MIFFLFCLELIPIKMFSADAKNIFSGGAILPTVPSPKQSGGIEPLNIGDRSSNNILKTQVIFQYGKI